MADRSGCTGSLESVRIMEEELVGLRRVSEPFRRSFFLLPYDLIMRAQQKELGEPRRDKDLG